MVPSKHKTPAMLAAVVTFLALVAGTTTIPTAQATDDAAGRPAGGDEVQEDHLARLARRLRDADLRQRQDQGQEGQEAGRGPPAEAALRLAEGRQGQDQRQGPVPPQGEDELVPQEDQDARRRAAHPQGRRQHQQGPRLHRQPGVRAPGRQRRVDPDRAGLQDPVQPLRPGALAAEHAVRPRRRQARGEGRAQAARRRDRHPLRLRRQDQGDPRAPAASGRATPTWWSPGPAPGQTKWNLLRQHHRSRRPAQDQVGPDRQGQAGRADHPLRPRHGQHVRGAGRLRRSQRARLDHRPRARSRRRPRPLARPDPADVPVGREHRQRHLPGR